MSVAATSAPVRVPKERGPAALLPVPVARLAGFAALTWLLGRRRDRRPLAWVAGLCALLALGALGAGWWEQRHYLERRYENLSPQLRLADAARWARDLRDAEVERHYRDARILGIGGGTTEIMNEIIAKGMGL